MEKFLTALTVGYVVLVIMMLYRVIKGPTIFDRLNGLGVIGSEVIILLILIGFIDKRADMFVDIAISYALLGFVSLIVLAKYLTEEEK
jgi:multicomponent Na+:H+ antiporter subunit F